MNDSASDYVRIKPGLLTTYCRDNRISRHQLARRMDFHVESVRRAEMGDTNLSGRFIASLMRATGLAFDELFDTGTAAGQRETGREA